MEFKDRLKELRILNNLSQMQLSLKTGLSQSAIAKWELGKTEPDLLTLWKIADFFDVSVDYLLGRKDV